MELEQNNPPAYEEQQRTACLFVEAGRTRPAGDSHQAITTMVSKVPRAGGLINALVDIGGFLQENKIPFTRLRVGVRRGILHLTHRAREELFVRAFVAIHALRTLHTTRTRTCVKGGRTGALRSCSTTQARLEGAGRANAKLLCREANQPPANRRFWRETCQVRSLSHQMKTNKLKKHGSYRPHEQMTAMTAMTALNQLRFFSEPKDGE